MLATTVVDRGLRDAPIGLFLQLFHSTSLQQDIHGCCCFAIEGNRPTGHSTGLVEDTNNEGYWSVTLIDQLLEPLLPLQLLRVTGWFSFAP